MRCQKVNKLIKVWHVQDIFGGFCQRLKITLYFVNKSDLLLQNRASDGYLRTTLISKILIFKLDPMKNKLTVTNGGERKV